MSTFGKKALENWDYEYTDKSRFTSSPKNTQLAILKKWYPIGEHGYIKNSLTEIVIKGYVEYTGHYGVYVSDNADFKINAHPLNIRLPGFEREVKIEKLLK